MQASCAANRHRPAGRILARLAGMAIEPENKMPDHPGQGGQCSHSTFNPKPTMTTFRIDDMSCSHCVGRITQALHALDPAMVVQVDLATHQVEIGSTQVTAAALSAAISEAGYTPLEVVDHPGRWPTH
jgi:copper chaperone